MGTNGGGSDVVVVNITRACAKQLLVALSLALGGKPIKKITKGKKGKGGKSGGGGGAKLGSGKKKT